MAIEIDQWLEDLGLSEYAAISCRCSIGIQYSNRGKKMFSRLQKISIAAVLFVLLGISNMAFAESSIDQFVEHWVGTGLTVNKGQGSDPEILDRKIEFIVTYTPRGFNLIWSNLRQTMEKGVQKRKQSSTSVEFGRTDHPGIFEMLAQGHLMQGGSYRWAALSDKTLIVHSIAISQQGILEHQTYARTLLTKDDMQLDYSLAFNNRIVRKVYGLMHRR